MAKKNKPTIEARRRLFFIRIFCFAAVLVVMMTLISKSFDLYQLNIEKKDKEKEYEELQEQSEYLRNEIIKLHDPEYIAKYAHEKYYYSKDGELIIKIVEDNEEETKAGNNLQKEKNEWAIYGAIGGAILVGYLFIRMIIRKLAS